MLELARDFTSENIIAYVQNPYNMEAVNRTLWGQFLREICPF
jgi:hypothetical protein